MQVRILSVAHIYGMRLSLKKLKQTILLEFGDDLLYQQLRAKYSNLPEYILRDMYRGSDEKFFSQLNRLQWRLEVIEVNPADFAPETRNKLANRAYGDINFYNIPDDERRTQFQRKLAATLPIGENEPIILVRGVDGYRLWEGWHRVMSLLRLGSNDGPPEEWAKIKIKAWVGSRV